MIVARVLPDVTGLDKEFDYRIPDEMRSSLQVGDRVRVELHGRRIGGWVLALSANAAPGLDVDELKSIAKVTGRGPDPSLIDLAWWAMVRWAARRLRPLLVAASPPHAVTTLPRDRRTGSTPGPTSPATATLLASGGGVLRLPPRADVMPSVLSAAAMGPVLVIVPEVATAALLAIRLRRAGLSVAEMPGGWAQAAAGVDVVIGARSAAWAPCRQLAAAIVVDEHDEALQEERTPTWHARDIVVERCRRAGVPFVLVSPAPTLVAVEECAGDGGVLAPPRDRERAGWSHVVVVDRTDEEPWKRSLITSPLIERIRNRELTVVCVSNTTGRARVLACRSCRSLVRCERCDAAVGLDDEGRLVCRRCDSVRPPVCQDCGASRFANLRPGVTRLREELEAAANRPVVAVTGHDTEAPPAAGIYVGTEAVLHRVRSADVVAFLEFDSEMLAPRYRATEQAMALIIRAARVAPELLVQTFSPEHELLAAISAGDPAALTDTERARRRLLSLPPYGALAEVSGSGARELVAQLERTDGLVVGGAEDAAGGGRYLVRGPDWFTLGKALNAAEREPGSRTRVAVDPPRV